MANRFRFQAPDLVSLRDRVLTRFHAFNRYVQMEITNNLSQRARFPGDNFLRIRSGHMLTELQVQRFLTEINNVAQYFQDNTRNFSLLGARIVVGVHQGVQFNIQLNNLDDIPNLAQRIEDLQVHHRPPRFQPVNSPTFVDEADFVQNVGDYLFRRQPINLVFELAWGGFAPNVISPRTIARWPS